MDLPTDAFARAMSDVLLTGKDTNLVVTCGDIIWKVHSKVLEGRSRYCQVLLKIDAVTSPTTKTYGLPYVDFSEYHPIVVDRLLEWIYTNKYTIDQPGQLHFSTLHSTENQIDPLKIPFIHMKLVLAGEDFMLVGLSSVALTQLGDSLKEWDAKQFTRLLLELHPKSNEPPVPTPLEVTMLRCAIKHHVELRNRADSRAALIFHAPWSFVYAWVEVWFAAVRAQIIRISIGLELEWWRGHWVLTG